MEKGLTAMTKATRLSRIGDPLLLIGKILLAALFWWDAIFVFVPSFQDVIGYIGQSILPFPKFVAIGTLAFLILAPASLFIKRTEVAGFLALAVFCLLTALIFHPYWTFAAEDRLNEQIHFMKDVALAGAMLTVAGLKLRVMT